MRKKKFWLAPIVAALLALVMLLPAQAATSYCSVNMADTYTLTMSISVKNLEGVKAADTVRSATLVISDNTVTTHGVITNATLTVTDYGTLAVAGFVGRGVNPKIELVGLDTHLSFHMYGRVRSDGGLPVSISGTIDGFGYHSQGALGDDPAGDAATWSVVNSYNGSIAALLTKGALTGSCYVQWYPRGGFTVADLATMSGWSFSHLLENNKGWGPQVELRFTHPLNINPDGAGHVDITLIPYQQNGTGAWVVTTLGPTTHCGYYGNDPWDATAFDEFSGTLTVADMLAAIDAEAAMLADGGFSAATWELTRVRVELWEGGARTCYIDDFVDNIDGHSDRYSFEPVSFKGNYTARP